MTRDPYDFIPHFFNIVIIGHQFVNADCRRLAPTNAVNQSQRISTKCASSKLIRMKNPAIPRNVLSMVTSMFIYGQGP